GRACVLSENVTAKSMLTLKKTTNTDAYMLTFGTNYNFCSGCGNNKGNDPVRFATDGQTDGGVPFVFVSEDVTIADDVKNAAIAKIEAYESTLYPFHGKIYALDSYMDYIYAKTDGSNGIYTNGSFTGTVDTRALWRLEYNYNHGSYNIKNVHTGLYIGATNHEQGVAMSETPGNYEVATRVGSETVENGKYYIKVKGQNACLHSYKATAEGWEGGGLGNQYRFVEVNEFSHTLNIGATGWATLILGFPAEIPAIEGDENGVFIATTSTVANSVHLTKIEEGVLPANTAVIVKASPNSKIVFNYSAETPVEINGNLLTGTLYDKNITEDAYVLTADANDANGVCFGLATKNQNSSSAFKNNANKAYLPTTAVAGASLSANLRFDFDGITTAIDEVETEAAETVIYDLTGRRVNEITKAGVYIINGHKVLVK
ncbi:MAG: hypothetical protein II244_07735, partial [Clostridia bacterium]|nr:hypothetical protein [Clostridia bacterium]